MSYLDAPRIHFFGGYFANPSAINNNLTNYDLKPPLDLSWNPDGSAFFRFRDCAVSSAVGHGGAVSAGDADDAITRAMVTTPQAPQPKLAKIVDLDPDQQTITQLYGVIVTVVHPGGKGGVTGRMAVAELRDLWFARVPGTGAGSETRRLDLSSYEAVSGSSAEVLEVISLPIDDPAHMPVTRDLSASRRLLIQTRIKNGCPEGEGDA